MHHRRVLLAVIVAALLLATPAGAKRETSERAPADGDWLWLAPPTPLSPLPNFTADAPTGTTLLAPGPIQVGSGEIVWKWIMPRTPAEWSVPAGTTFTTDLVFLGLDRVLPLVHPDHDPTEVGRIEVRIDVLRLSSDTGIATGARYLDPDLPGTEGMRTTTITATADEDVRYGTTPGDAPLFGLKVTLTGFAQNDEPPLMVVAHPDHPARIQAPGFPVQALREWNQHDDTEASCNERVLQQMSCDDEAGMPVVVPQRDDGAVARVEEAPGYGIVGLLGLAGMALAVRRVSVSRQ